MKCHHLWCTGCGRAAPSSRARSSRQHSMVHTDQFHWFHSKVTEEPPWLPRTPAGWGRGLGPSQLLLLSLPTLSPRGPGLPLPGPCQLLSLHCSGVSLHIVRAPGLSLSLSTCLCLPLKTSKSRSLHLISVPLCPRRQHFSIFLCCKTEQREHNSLVIAVLLLPCCTALPAEVATYPSHWQSPVVPSCGGP